MDLGVGVGILSLRANNVDLVALFQPFSLIVWDLQLLGDCVLLALLNCYGMNDPMRLARWQWPHETSPE
jgi:hypothetical protein